MTNRVVDLSLTERKRKRSQLDKTIEPLSLASMIGAKSLSLCNIDTIDQILQRTFDADPSLGQMRCQYYFNLGFIIDVCSNRRKRNYIMTVISSCQEQNLCSDTLDTVATDNGESYSPEDQEQYEKAMALLRDVKTEADETQNDNDLVLNLTKQNLIVKKKNKEIRKTLQNKKKQRSESLIKTRLISGQSNDIFNMFKRICAPTGPDPLNAAGKPADVSGHDPNSMEVVEVERGFLDRNGGVVATRLEPNPPRQKMEEHDELFNSMYWTMIRNTEGYVKYICDCICDYENRKLMTDHSEVVCPYCNRKELVHASAFASNWNCKHCSFYFSKATVNSPTDGGTGDDGVSDMMLEMNRAQEQEMNKETSMVNDMYVGCDYKTRQEYEYNRNGNKINPEKHRINYQNYLKEFLTPNLKAVSERHMDLIRREMALNNNSQPYKCVDEVNVPTLHQTLHRLNMKCYIKFTFSIVYQLVELKPALLTNTLFEQFMDDYRRLSIAFNKYKASGECNRRTMIRNSYVFQRTCENHNITCFRRFYSNISSSQSVNDHRRIYEWCCRMANISYK